MKDQGIFQHLEQPHIFQHGAPEPESNPLYQPWQIDKYIINNNYHIYNNIESEFCDSDFFMLPSSPAQAMLIIDGLQTAFNDDPFKHETWMDATESGSLLMVTPLIRSVDIHF